MSSSYEVVNPSSNQYESSTSDSAHASGGLRSRIDTSNTLLHLPAPLAMNRGIMNSNSTFVSRSSEDAYTSDYSNQRLLSSAQSQDYADGFFEGRRETPSPRTSSRPGHSYGETQNPFRSPDPMVSSPMSYSSNEPGGFMSDPEERQSPRRGVGLTDSGPVPGPEGVRRVSRSANRRSTAQMSPQNRYSRGSYGLPPGAAPPQHNYGGGL
jgi:chitin synthase